MITLLRQKFNQQYTDAAYERMLSDLARVCGTPVSFRIAETPCFLPAPLLDELSRAGEELTSQLLSDESYLRHSLEAIPPGFRMSADTPHPHFMTADFGFVREPDGSVSPKLVELQAFPSVFAFQALLGEMYQQHFHMDAGLHHFLNGHTPASFWDLFRMTVLGGNDAREVVLAEIHPGKQKTLPDFNLTSRALGIRTVDVTGIEVDRQQGRTRLFYRSDKGLQPIRRIYNRVIVDELIQKNIQLPFDYREDLDVEWAGHPNWYFRISKFSIPFLRHATVPEAAFLDDWLAGAGSERLHRDRSDILLKPLFSFAGKGILFAPTKEQLAAIPAADHHEYLIQEKVNFAPTIDTPFGPTQAEIRILYLWPDGGTMEPVLSLARLGRGKMMGVDHNKDQRWIGASTVYYPGT